MASSSVRGISHIKNNTKCQDKTLCLHNENYQMIGLADGAGSCLYSDIGAEEILKFIYGEFLFWFDDYFTSINCVQKLTKKIEIAIDVIANIHKKRVEELSSTLLFVVIKNDKFIAGHIGDGVIGKLDDKNQITVLSKPQNGKSNNLTWFTTSSYNPHRLRIYSGNIENISGFILMSDGVELGLYDSENVSLVPITGSIINLLSKNTQKEVSKKLEEQLKKVFQKITYDDLSIAIMKKERFSYDKNRTLPQGKKDSKKWIRGNISKRNIPKYCSLGEYSKQIFQFFR